MKRHLNTIFPVMAVIPKLFGTKTKKEFVDSLAGNHEITGPISFDLNEAEMVNDLELEDSTKIKNHIPGAIEIPLQRLVDAGFTIKCYMKQSTENCIDDKNEAGVLIFSIQHSNPNESFMVDGFSTQLDTISEIEIATLNAAILNDEQPGIFGEKYDIEQAQKVGSIRIRDILLEREEARKIREKKIEEYNANPELREKHTKKAVENLKFKFKSAQKGNGDLSKDFTEAALKILGTVAGINNLKSFDELKEIPVFKKEIDAGGSFAELLGKFCEMTKALPGVEAGIEDQEPKVSDESEHLVAEIEQIK